jgi:hypothetical protein
MNEFIIIIVVVLMLCLTFYLICQTKFRTYVYALLLDAEKTEDDGQTKMDYVCTNAYEYIPSFVKIFISYSGFRIIIQNIYDKMRDLARDGKVDGVK